MIDIDIDETQGVAILKPTELARLTQDDFKAITDRIDGYLQDHDALRGLVIVADHFPGWDSVQAFTSHIKLIRDHHKRINRVAIVSDSPLLSAAPHFMDHFVTAKVRHFGLAELAKAKTWAAQDVAPLGRFVILEGFPDDVAAIRAEGIITREDYENTLIPLLEDKIKSQGKVKMLYWCGEEFKGFSAGAMWDDARFGLTHLRDLAKVAVVTDVEWLRMSMKMFVPLIGVPMQLYHNAEVEDAKAWISLR